MILVVDCEATGGSPSTGFCTEVGIASVDKDNYGMWRASYHKCHTKSLNKRTALSKEQWEKLDSWLNWKLGKGTRHIMFSDNPAFDFQWVNDGLLLHVGRNLFGHSARRISDFYAGLVGNIYDTQTWKKLRVTPHTHNALDDAMGNAEALVRILQGER